jgi:hypothetical protein
MPMQYRSTNAFGATHFGGALVVGAELESGIELNPTSSGASVVITAAGDETNKGIILKGKGTGAVQIGDSSQAVSIGGGTAFKGFKVDTGTTQFAAISSGQTLEVPLSTAVTGVNAGDLWSIETVITPTVITFGGARIDVDVTTRVTMVLQNPGSTAGSTGRVIWRIVYADLT